MGKGLSPAVTQHVCRLILSHGYGFYTGTVYFCEISRVVDGKAYYYGYEPVTVAYPYVKKIEGAEKHHYELKHKGRSSEYGYEYLRQTSEGRYFGHPAKRHQQTQGKGKKQGKDKYKHRLPEAAGQLHHHCGKGHIYHSFQLKPFISLKQAKRRRILSAVVQISLYYYFPRQTIWSRL